MDLLLAFEGNRNGNGCEVRGGSCDTPLPGYWKLEFRHEGLGSRQYLRSVGAEKGVGGDSNTGCHLTAQPGHRQQP